MTHPVFMQVMENLNGSRNVMETDIDQVTVHEKIGNLTFRKKRARKCSKSKTDMVITQTEQKTSKSHEKSRGKSQNFKSSKQYKLFHLLDYRTVVEKYRAMCTNSCWTLNND